MILSDLRKEAQYNLGVANAMLAEVARFRAAAQPDTFATFQRYFRAKDMLATALTRVVSSGKLYRIFTEREITDIQQYAQFFNPQMETQFIAGRINQLKEAMDIAEAHNLANYLDGQVRQGIATLTNISQKR